MKSHSWQYCAGFCVKDTVPSYVYSNVFPPHKDFPLCPKLEQLSWKLSCGPTVIDSVPDLVFTVIL